MNDSEGDPPIYLVECDADEADKSEFVLVLADRRNMSILIKLGSGLLIIVLLHYLYIRIP